VHIFVNSAFGGCKHRDLGGLQTRPYVRGMSNAVGYGDPTAPGSRLHKYGVAVWWAQPVLRTGRGEQRPYGR